MGIEGNQSESNEQIIEGSATPVVVDPPPTKSDNGESDNRPRQQTAMVRAKPMAFSNRGVVITNFTELGALCKQLADSRYFARVDTPAQAMVKVQYGAELGIPPIASMLGIHIIEGRPSLSAAIINARIEASGNRRQRVKKILDKDGRVIGQEWDSEHCCLVFEGRDRNEETGQWGPWEWLGESEFTREDAMAAGLLPGKDGSNWRKWPKAMYFARALSQGARAYCSAVFFGAVYTPEELDADFVDMNPGTGEARPESEQPAPKAESARAKAKSAGDTLSKWAGDKSDAVDAVIEPTAQTQPKATSKAKATEPAPTPAPEESKPPAPAQAASIQANEEGEERSPEERVDHGQTSVPSSTSSTPTDAGEPSVPASPPTSAATEKPAPQPAPAAKAGDLLAAMREVDVEGAKVTSPDQAAGFLQTMTKVIGKYSKKLNEKEGKQLRLYARGVYNGKRGGNLAPTTGMNEDEQKIYKEALALKGE